MGKSLYSQRRGKGSFTFLATHERADARYISIDENQTDDMIIGEIVDLVKDSGRNTALAKVLFEDGREELTIAPEHVFVGQRLEYGKNARIKIGNVLPLESIPDGCPICNIEKSPGDGGYYVKSTGLYGLVGGKEGKFANVKLPSGKTLKILLGARATIGCVCGGGRKEKPFMKAGRVFHLMKSRRKHYPGLRGVAMNAVNHPFGGSQHHAGKSKSTSRFAPPGRKVGAIASKRTGRKKKL